MENARMVCHVYPFNSIEWIPELYEPLPYEIKEEILSIPLNGFIKNNYINTWSDETQRTFNSIEWIRGGRFACGFQRSFMLSIPLNGFSPCTIVYLRTSVAFNSIEWIRLDEMFQAFKRLLSYLSIPLNGFLLLTLHEYYNPMYCLFQFH